MRFGLVERFEGDGNTCVDCASKLRPSSFGECKATPMKTKRHIEATAKESLRQCREWSKRIMAVVDAEKSR